MGMRSDIAVMVNRCARVDNDILCNSCSCLNNGPSHYLRTYPQFCIGSKYCFSMHNHRKVEPVSFLLKE